MKAIVRQVYGPPAVLALEAVATPVPGDNEVLVRTRAASINLGDWELFTGCPFSLDLVSLPRSYRRASL